ncbi:MerR family transcriptional regulator [Nocardiopsis xinjiangensis]|uniref:MerR family transcriptional regulator n=1 Tax=Nocardiopsis xinjiangensis TaxID=124285 RepID=UPI00034A7133|nr:MerR family transcriptional regulator [Nocardiopsis xinjiangensis]
MCPTDPRLDERLTTASVAAATGYSVQQVRDLEALGALPPAPRAANGYRVFTGEHVRVLCAYRDLALAVGPVRARGTLRDVRTLPGEEALALLSSLHVGLVRERDDALAAQEALRAIREENGTEAAPTSEDTMTITELAGALGVRTSTLRFWEKKGLVVAERVDGRVGAARRYPLAAIREARIAAALRAAGYRIPEVRDTMGALRGFHGVDDPLDALEERVGAIARRMSALLRAGAELAGLTRGVRSGPRG